MSESWRRLVGVTALCLVAGFGVIFVYSMIEYSGQPVLAYFKWDWIFANTWAELLRLAPVAQAWAALLTFSWLVPAGSPHAAVRGSSVDRFGSALVALLGMGLVFAVVFLVWHPAAVATRSGAVFASSVAENLKHSADDAEADQDFARAVTYLQQYQIVTRHEDASVRTVLRELTGRARSEALHAEAIQGAQDSPIPGGAEAPDMVDRAEAALQQDDYSTAHYMATVAQILDPTNDEAARIAAESLRHLEEDLPTQEEEAEATYFRDLLAAKNAIGRGDYVDAYYRLSRLHDERPADRDVQRYLALAADRATSLSLFLDDAQTALVTAESQDVLFVNRMTDDYTELVYLGRVAQLDGVVYVQRVEVYRVDFQGTVERYVTSDYGKVDNGRLVLRVLDRENSELSTEPRYLVGTPDGPGGFIEITPTANELLVLAAAAREPEAVPVSDLFSAIRLMENHRMAAQPLRMELVMRLVAPFNYILMGLFAIGVGWRYRSRYLSQPIVLTLLIVPLLPLLIAPLFGALQYGQRVILATFMLWTGQTGAILLAVGIQAILLALGLAYVALSTRE
jgi:hypothetical protein